MQPWHLVVTLVGAFCIGLLLDHLFRVLGEWAYAVQHTKPGATWGRFACCFTCFQVRPKRTGRVCVYEDTRYEIGRFRPIPVYALAWHCRECAPAAELIEAMTGYDLHSLEAERRDWMTSRTRFGWSPNRSWIPRT